MVNIVYFYGGEHRVSNQISVSDELYMSINSLCQSKKPESIYNIHIYYTDIKDDFKKKLLSFGSDNMHIDVIKSEIQSSSLNDDFIAKLDILSLPDVDKFIYIDCDTFVVDDLSELMNINVSSFVFSGAYDRNMTPRSHDGTYVNAGVLLINSKLYKNCNIEELKNYALTHESWDQDALNTLPHGFIPEKYNIGPGQVKYSDLDENPGIYHYCGQDSKPGKKQWTEFWENLRKKYSEDKNTKNDDAVSVIYYVYPNWSVPNLFDQLELSIKSLMINRDFSRQYTIVIISPKEHISLVQDHTSGLSCSDLKIEAVGIDTGNLSSRNEILASKLYAIEYAARRFKRFILLDVDTVITNDIGELFDSNIYGSMVGGVEDTPLVYLRKLKRPGYINSGVVLVNSSLIMPLLSRNIQYVVSGASKLPYHDQDWINDNCTRTLLDRRFNTMVGAGTDDITYKQIHNAVVIHYAGSFYRDIHTYGKNIPKSLISAYEHACTSKTTKKYKILLARVHRAFGDWIIFADVLRAINDTYPEIQVDVLDNGNARLDVLTQCGCRYMLVSNPKIEEYDGYDPHVLYNTNPVTPNKHIIVSALENTCLKIPVLDIRKFNVLNLVSPVSLPEEYEVPTGKYVIVPHYYPPLVSSRVKDYSKDNYNKLVSLLTDAGYAVYELNSGNVEYRYTESIKSFDRSKGIISTTNIRETAKILRMAHFCVLIENGMNHWACHNGARSYCIFKSPIHARPNSLNYNTMIPIECYNNESPEYVFSEIMKHEDKR